MSILYLGEMQPDTSKKSGKNVNELVNVVCESARKHRNPGSHRYKENTHPHIGSTPQILQELTKNYW